ncbi:MAG: HlyD family efflux transporter periplasmic adaptor subunit [Acidobacteria bacterium]|nr:HlyD family efflux transporter periplasmic adaptor subunit [Acidobacteriota bacterium]
MLALGVPAAFASFASIVLAAAIAALITFGSYARRINMEGTILPRMGLIAVSSPSAGWIATLAVQEGETVEKDTLLYTLDMDTTTKGGKTQQQIINAETAEREMLTREAERKTQIDEEIQRQLRKKIDNLNMQIGQISGQIILHQSFYETINKEYNLFLNLLERRQATLNEMEAREQAWMQAQSKLEDLEGSKLRLIGELDDAQYQLTSIGISTADEIDGLKNRIFDIDEKLANSEARRSIEVRAPEAGVVTAIIGHPGQVVGSGAPMMKIVPKHAAMRAELLAPSNAIGFIHQGDRVLLRYSAFPYQKFGEYWGTVVAVSDAALTPEEVQSLMMGAQPSNHSATLGLLPTKDTGPFYRVIVKPDSQFVNVYGKNRKLPVNMQVQGYAILDRRPLYQWIVEPLYDVGRIAHRL